MPEEAAATRPATGNVSSLEWGLRELRICFRKAYGLRCSRARGRRGRPRTARLAPLLETQHQRQ
eukprot:1127462-Pyramimonas_sp.AAC.1